MVFFSDNFFKEVIRQVRVSVAKSFIFSYDIKRYLSSSAFKFSMYLNK